ncbi:MAG: SagB/ThcOx family dehydrogenase [Dehalococcoidia bacterium]|nr:MAG: SagB/ThcOx family dehydrogenase [Dehalococcoidia bacterium]
MLNKKLFTLLSMFCLALYFSACSPSDSGTLPLKDNMNITLPEPNYDGDVSVEEAIFNRRSIRNYINQPLTLQEVSQLLWSAQGITNTNGNRAAPSAGATYPLEIYIVVGDVYGINDGIYRYNPQQNELIKILGGQHREALSKAALNQRFIADASLDIVITAIYERTTARYGERGIRYVHMEAGHAAENVYLQAFSLGLGTVVVGAFNDDGVSNIMALAENEVPLYIMPVGRTSD